VPQVSNTTEPFGSRTRQMICGRTEELERLAMEMALISASERVES
jgi:hypothetical protein